MTPGIHTGESGLRGSAPDVSVHRASWFRIRLCVLSGVMLGLSFPPSPFGILACFGLVPLLIVLADIRTIRKSLFPTYVAMMVFHVITLNWTGDYVEHHDVYMMIAGAAVMLLHPAFYFIPVSIYMFVKKHLGEWAALLALPFAWVGYEYSHELSEWSFPWLTLGNSQSYDLSRIQFIDFTGVYGLSFWILLINVLVYILYSGLARQRFRPVSGRAIGLALLILVLYNAPSVQGAFVLSGAPGFDVPPVQRGEKPITVGMVQANIDPWEKWTTNGYQTLELYLRKTESLVESTGVAKPDIVLWPETAIPFYLLAPANRPLLTEIRARAERLGVSILTGLPQVVFYPDSILAPASAKRIEGTGERYDSFNAAAFLQPGTDSVQWYGKMHMVPFAERVPYADALSFLKFLRWGVGIGGWQIGPDTTIFVDRKTGARFCTPICYESVYPAFVAAFVRKGAEFISVITVDSWWDHMSGAYQHAQFAIFRAVENRRWIARCAVGGISCYIDPYGREYDRTELFTQRLLSCTIGRRSDLTFYTEHGDWLGQVCILLSGLFLAAGFGQKFTNNVRARSWQRD